jgi:hypothetical protein
VALSGKWDNKDPDEVVDYSLDWGGTSIKPGRSYGDVIMSSTWTVPVGLVKNSDSFTATSTTIWLSSGTEGTTYKLNNRVVTSGGRTWDQTVKLKIKTK